MYNIKTLNAISPVYQEVLPADSYVVGSEVSSPDAILVRSAEMHGYDFNKELLCVARAGAGVNNLPLDEMAKAGIVAFNTPGANANAVKELVVAGLLLASRKISEGINWCNSLTGDDVEKQVESGKKQFVGPELAGKTLGVVGLGAIGVEVANVAVALGMNVLGYDPYISVEHAWKLSRSVKHSTDPEELLRSSDYITIHVPLMEATKNIIDEADLQKVKPTCALLNFARDGLVNVEAVKKALEENRLRIYVTDFPNKSVMGVKNVVMTPHLGASTPESEENCVRMAGNQVDDYLRNGSIVNSVNYPNCKVNDIHAPRITLLHQNVPNVIGSITQILSEEGLNIANMVNKSRGSVAYTVVDVESAPSEARLSQLRALDTMYRVRLLMP